MSDQHRNPADDRVIVGHEDLGAVDGGTSNSGKYIATATAVALLMGGVTYGITRSGNDAPADNSAANEVELPDSGDGSSDGTGTGNGTVDADPAPAADGATDAGGSSAGSSDGESADTGGGSPADSPSDPGPDTESGDGLFDDDLLDFGIPLPERARGSICPAVWHQPIVDQRSDTGIWVEGSIYGLPKGTYIWVEAPTINNGDPVSVPIVDDAFQAPLGINSYGDHPLDTFEIRDASGATMVDLVPAFPGNAVLTVGPDEGPLLDEPCFDVDLPVESAGSVDGSISEQAGADQAGDVIGDDPDHPTVPEQVEAFFDRFVDQHADRNAEALIFTMYGPMRDAHGPGVCDDYIRSTAGSIASADVQSVGELQPLSIDTPSGQLDIEQTVPVTVEFETFSGDTFVNDANLVIDGDQVSWLTRCGTE